MLALTVLQVDSELRGTAKRMTRLSWTPTTV